MSYRKRQTKKVCVSRFSDGPISTLEMEDSVEIPAHQAYLSQLSVFETERGESMYPFMLASDLMIM